MAIEALKKVFQVSTVKREREVDVSRQGQKRQKPERGPKGRTRGKIDIKV